MLRHIPLGTMMNLRDLGGYPTADGRETKWERLLRGDQPATLTDSDLCWLLDRNITTVVDLRSEGEMLHGPDPLASAQGFAYFHCPLSGGGFMPNLEDDVGKGYFTLLDEGNRMRAVMRRIAAAPGGVLFHCSAGKDRTGCTAALLLLLAGVSMPDVLADYQVTETYIMEFIKLLKAEEPDSPAFWGQSRPAYMERCIGHLLEKYGTVAGYLRAIGLTEAELDHLSAKLLG